MLGLLLASIAVFLSYNVAIIAKFGVPSSLSETFYILNNYKKNLGILFTLLLYTMTFTLLPVWFSLPTNENYDFILFFCGAMLAFVGAAPAFRGADKGWHSAFAGVSAVAGMIWTIVATPYWYILLVSAALIMGTMLLTNTKKALTYWLEMIMFITIYVINSIYLLK